MLLRLLSALAALLVGGQEIATLKPGAVAPSFELQTLDGKKTTSAELLGDAKERNIVVLVFWAVQCPWVERCNPELETLFRDFSKQRVRLAMVDSDRNDTADPAAISAFLTKAKYTFPVYLDVGNKVADAFGARTTPHCFVIGKDGKLVYSGRVNDARPIDDSEAAAASKDATSPPPVNPLLKKAIAAALEGRTPEVMVDTPVGCRIKRK
jgi:peroxiredoxin